MLLTGLPCCNGIALEGNGTRVGKARIPKLNGVSSFHGELGNLTSQDNDRFRSDVAISVHHADLDYQGYQAL